jgi:hypothetical protein
VAVGSGVAMMSMAMEEEAQRLKPVAAHSVVEAKLSARPSAGRGFAAQQ